MAKNYENTILGLALKSSKNLESILDSGIKPEHFTKFHAVFDMMSRNHKKGESFGIDEIISFFPQFSDAIISITQQHLINPKIDFHISAFKGAFYQKQLSKYAIDIHNLNQQYSPLDKLGELKNQVKEGFEKLEKNIVQIDNYGEAANVIAEKFLEEQERRQTTKEPPGYKTGFKYLDESTGGMRKGKLSFIGARPGWGKTTFALNIFRNVVMLQDVHGLFFTNELDAQEIFIRMVCSIAKVKIYDCEKGRLTPDELDKIYEATKILAGKKFKIIDKTQRIFDSVEDEIISQHRKGLCDFVVIDYLQEYRLANSPQSRFEELSKIVHELHFLCRKLKIPILVPAQLNRNYARDENADATASFKWTGAVEEYADFIMIIKQGDDKETKKINIAKSRMGFDGDDIYFNVKDLGEYGLYECTENAKGYQGVKIDGK